MLTTLEFLLQEDCWYWVSGVHSHANHFLITWAFCSHFLGLCTCRWFQKCLPLFLFAPESGFYPFIPRVAAVLGVDVEKWQADGPYKFGVFKEKIEITGDSSQRGDINL